jgi:membrane dipeptidase
MTILGLSQRRSAAAMFDTTAVGVSTGHHDTVAGGAGARQRYGIAGVYRRRSAMKLRPALAAWLAAAMVIVAGVLEAQPGGVDLERRVREVHAAARPLDAHADILVPTTPGIYRTADGESQLTVDKLVAGGMATVTLALQSPTGPATAEGIATARAEVDAKLARLHALEAEHADRLGLARSSADIERLHAAGKIAVLIGFQNAYALGTDIDLVDHYVAAGVRVFAFNHAGNNAFGDSSRPAIPGDEPNGGLSALGREAVRRLNALGVVIDVSQLTPAGVMQTLTLSRAPVIASHSAVRALIDETRNLSDEELAAIAAKGGVVHVPPFNTYVAPRPPEFVAELGALRVRYGLPPEFRGVLDDAERLTGAARGEYTNAALKTVPRADLDDYLDHIDYVVQRIGVEHVGIGTDFDHGAGIVGYRDASEAPNLTRGLLARGYSPDDIAKIWSGNFIRVLRAAEAAAR